jgi:hypothetical protein
MKTPWGVSQSSEQIAPGVWFVSTSSHGGLFLTGDAKRRVINAFPTFKPFAGWPWFEEDCDASAVFAVLHEFFDDDQARLAVRMIENPIDKARWAPVRAWLATTKDGLALLDRVSGVSV